MYFSGQGQGQGQSHYHSSSLSSSTAPAVATEPSYQQYLAQQQQQADLSASTSLQHSSRPLFGGTSSSNMARHSASPSYIPSHSPSSRSAANHFASSQSQAHSHHNQLLSAMYQHHQPPHSYHSFPSLSASSSGSVSSFSNQPALSVNPSHYGNSNVLPPLHDFLPLSPDGLSEYPSYSGGEDHIFSSRPTLPPTPEQLSEQILDKLEQAGRVPSKEKFRRMACNTFVFTGACPYNDRCVFLHDYRIKADGMKVRTTRQTKANSAIKDTFYWPDMTTKEVIRNTDSQGLPTANQIYVIPESFKSNPSNFHNRGLYSMWAHFVEFCIHNNAMQNHNQVRDVSSEPFFQISGYKENPHVLGAKRSDVLIRLSMGKVFCPDSVQFSPVQTSQTFCQHSPPPSSSSKAAISSASSISRTWSEISPNDEMSAFSSNSFDDWTAEEVPIPTPVLQQTQTSKPYSRPVVSFVPMTKRSFGGSDPSLLPHLQSISEALSDDERFLNSRMQSVTTDLCDDFTTFHHSVSAKGDVSMASSSTLYDSWRDSDASLYCQELVATPSEDNSLESCNLRSPMSISQRPNSFAGVDDALEGNLEFSNLIDDFNFPCQLSPSRSAEVTAEEDEPYQLVFGSGLPQSSSLTFFSTQVPSSSPSPWN